MNLDPVWIIAAGFWLCGALCGLAWNEGRVEAARQDGEATGHTEGYAQGRADAVTLAKQQIARAMGHETQPVISVQDAIRRANERMQQT